MSDRDARDSEVAELVKAERRWQTAASASLVVADFDNYGSLDLLVGE